jgi:hypothetical protein
LRPDWQLKKAIFANPDTKTEMVSELYVRRTALHLRFIFVPFALHLRFFVLAFALDTRSITPSFALDQSPRQDSLGEILHPSLRPLCA